MEPDFLTSAGSSAPYMRYQTYNGGKKAELDARSHWVKELEIGVEWQPVRQSELTAAYTIASRRFEDFILQNNLQKGILMRKQAQVNFRNLIFT